MELVARPARWGTPAAVVARWVSVSMLGRSSLVARVEYRDRLGLSAGEHADAYLVIPDSDCPNSDVPGRRPNVLVPPRGRIGRVRARPAVVRQRRRRDQIAVLGRIGPDRRAVSADPLRLSRPRVRPVRAHPLDLDPSRVSGRLLTGDFPDRTPVHLGSAASVPAAEFALLSSAVSLVSVEGPLSPLSLSPFGASVSFRHACLPLPVARLASLLALASDRVPVSIPSGSDLFGDPPALVPVASPLLLLEAPERPSVGAVLSPSVARKLPVVGPPRPFHSRGLALVSREKRHAHRLRDATANARIAADPPRIRIPKMNTCALSAGTPPPPPAVALSVVLCTVEESTPPPPIVQAWTAK